MVTRRTGLIRRQAGFRDARLFIVATEGARTEPQYIAHLKLQGWIDRSRVIVEVIPTQDGTSSPNHVIHRLSEAQQRFQALPSDECWLVLDVDRWGPRLLSEVAQEATQKGYKLAISNPCFELWLLLHFTDSAPSSSSCAAIEEQLRQIHGSFNKSNLDGTLYTRERVNEAVERARRLDSSPTDRWPQSPPGTHAYRLFTRILT